MAIIKCFECGKRVSTLAKSCPHCGCQIEGKILEKSDSVETEKQAFYTENYKIHLDEELNKKVKWYDKSWFLWVLLILLPPIGILFMWIRKKDFTNRKKIILSVVFALWFIIAQLPGNEKDTEIANTDSGSDVVVINSDEDANSGTKNNSDQENSEDILDIELTNDFEKAIWRIITDNNGSLDTIYYDEMLEGKPIISIELSCENNEDIVTPILEAISEVAKSNNIDKLITVYVSEAEKDDILNLIIADIQVGGAIDIIFENPNYNSHRNSWIKSQFSVWDGSHTKLEKMIINNLNDEKSYKHVETTYIDIISEDRKQEVNKILADSGYSARVQINDLFILTTFSAKNAFDATIKNTAFGISSYANQTITLVGIE